MSSKKDSKHHAATNGRNRNEAVEGGSTSRVNNQPPSSAALSESLPPIYAAPPTSSRTLDMDDKAAAVDRSGLEESMKDERPSAPPLRGPTTSIGSLPPIFASSQTSSNAAGDRNTSNNTVSQAATTTEQPSYDNNNGLAVAELVRLMPSAFADFGDDLDDHIEDQAIQERAIALAQRVLRDIELNAVNASTAIGIEEPQSFAESEMLNNNNKEQQRIRRLRGTVALLVGIVVAVVVALVVVLVTRGDGNSSPISTVKPESCSFCAGGAQSPTALDMLSLLPIGETSGTTITFPTCGDLYQYGQSLSSTDSSCPVYQVLAFKYCSCPTVPPRPLNASCTSCSTIVTNSEQCAKVDTAVSILGSALFYLRQCSELRDQWFMKDSGCICPSARNLR